MSTVESPETSNAADSAAGSGQPKPTWPKWLLAVVLVLGLGGCFALGYAKPAPLFLSALLGAAVLAVRQGLRWRARWRTKLAVLAGGAALLAAAGWAYVSHRYQVAETMDVPLREFDNREYPDDPAGRSVYHGRYDGRTLTLVQKDAAHFDFLFEPLNQDIARVVIHDVDVSLMTPGLPQWTRDDADLARIALTDRQWNRQQVRFAPDSPQVEITGGDGFERANIDSVELAKNCLNAGLWEVLLFVRENDAKALYYHGWFTFPMGHYRNIFEQNTGLPYSRHWYYLEHWVDPTGTPVPLEKLRRVVEEREVPGSFDLSEPLIARGDQINKRRTTLTENLRVWGDFYDGRTVEFATFVPPGRYSVDVPRDTQYRRMDHFDKAILRRIESPATDVPLDELELVFSSREQPGVCRFIVSGFNLAALPQLPIRDYPRGLYLPMGIGTPPFHQGYDELRQHPPDQGPYVSVLLDGEGGWIDHHAVGVDGPVMHRDEEDPALLHVYLLSYERHSLVAHLVLRIDESQGLTP